MRTVIIQGGIGSRRARTSFLVCLFDENQNRCDSESFQ